MTFFYMLLAFIIGLALGWFLWGRLRGELQSLQSNLDSIRGERDKLKTDTARLTRELEDCGAARANLEGQRSDNGAAYAPAALISTSVTTEPSRAISAKRGLTKSVAAKATKFVREKNEARKSRQAATSKKDNLRRMIGVGPVNERKLNQHGITTYAQIAAWTTADIKQVEGYLEFDGRIKREKWVQQAKLLAAGNEAEFARRFPTAGRSSNS
ncbi:MAG: proton-conducting membrane transporter [Mesorhizobium sp.]